MQHKDHGKVAIFTQRATCVPQAQGLPQQRRHRKGNASHNQHCLPWPAAPEHHWDVQDPGFSVPCQGQRITNTMLNSAPPSTQCKHTFLRPANQSATRLRCRRAQCQRVLHRVEPSRKAPVYPRSPVRESRLSRRTAVNMTAAQADDPSPRWTPRRAPAE